MQRVLRVFVGLGAVVAVGLLGGCSGPGRPAPASDAATATATATSAPAPTSTGPTAVDTGPVVAGPTATTDGACALLSLAEAMNDIGERLGRVTTSTSGGATVGCTFYPIGGTGLATSEHLPAPTVPVIEISTSRFADVTSAHNAMVELSRVDPLAYQDPIVGADEAISFATTFYAPDGTQDRAFTFRKGTTVTLVQIAQTTPAFNAQHIGTDIAPVVA